MMMMMLANSQYYSVCSKCSCNSIHTLVNCRRVNVWPPWRVTCCSKHVPKQTFSGTHKMPQVTLHLH